jgi:hypothetical protein
MQRFRAVFVGGHASQASDAGSQNMFAPDFAYRHSYTPEFSNKGRLAAEVTTRHDGTRRLSLMTQSLLAAFGANARSMHMVIGGRSGAMLLKPIPVLGVTNIGLLNRFASDQFS